MSVAACAALVERSDPERYLAVMAAPVWARERLFPLYAFNLEVARAPWVSCTMFCKKIDMPIAEIKGARRVEPRKGRYAVRSTAQP